jgi:flavin-dependent dehydrogenase
VDVLICGASFAGLAVARELRGAGADVLVIDRYEVGERQTSACAAPTELLEHMGLGAAIRQTFGTLLVHTPRVTGHIVHTDRGDLEAPLIVDALGWRRVLGAGANFQPPDGPLSRGLEVHPRGTGEDLELWLDRRYVAPGYSWSFPAGGEVRVGVGSFDPRVAVKEPTVRLVADVGRRPDGYQGNWIPHRLRPAAEDGVFFVGDSAGHCLPVTAEGIRTALLFGVAAGREIRAVLEGRQDREAALRAYAAHSAAHRHEFESMYRVQQLIRHLHGPVMDALVRLFTRPAVSLRAFRRYLDIAPPELALPAPPDVGARTRPMVATAAAANSPAAITAPA